MGVDGGVSMWGGSCTEPSSRPVLPQLESLPYDERPLPAARKQPGAVATEPETRDTDSSEPPRVGTMGEPEPLTEKALREASSAVDVLGEALVRTEARINSLQTTGGGGRLHRAPRLAGPDAATALCPHCSMEKSLREAAQA